MNDSPLTDLGYSQANTLAEWFRNQCADQIYSSPLKRAKQTAEVIASSLGLGLVVTEDLIERRLGEYEGMRIDHLYKVRSDRGHSFGDITQDWEGVREVESDRAIFDRVTRLIERIPKETNSLLVTHAGVIKAFLHSSLYLDKGRSNFFSIKNGCILQLVGANIATLKLTMFCNPTDYHG